MSTNSILLSSFASSTSSGATFPNSVGQFSNGTLGTNQSMSAQDLSQLLDRAVISPVIGIKPPQPQFSSQLLDAFASSTSSGATFPNSVGQLPNGTLVTNQSMSAQDLSQLVKTALPPPSVSSSSHSLRLSAIAPSAPQAPSCKQIFQQMRHRICQVMTEKGKATAICIDKKRIAVPFHMIGVPPNNNEGQIELAKFETIQCFCNDVLYSAKPWFTSKKLSDYLNADCIIYEIEDSEECPFLEREPIDIFTKEIEPGETVWFGGFPLTQREATFHVGTVSSVSEEEGFCSFSIDGTVVSGNSGGPVFVLDEGILKLAGMVFQQIADFLPEDRQTIQILEAISKQGFGGVFHTIKVPTPQGEVEKRINDTQAITLALGLIQRNLSTGMGRAVHVQHLKALISGEEIPSSAFLGQLGVSVGKKEKKHPVYKTEDGREFSLNSDRHTKHIAYSWKWKESEFFEKTKSAPATFYKAAAERYEQLLALAIRTWADKGAKDPKHVTFSEPVGVDRGKETATVEIYYDSILGSHIRPKYVESSDEKEN